MKIKSPILFLLALSALFVAFLRAQTPLPAPPVARNAEELAIQAQGMRAVYLPQTVVEERKVKPVDPDKLFIVDSTKSGFALFTMTPNYRIYVGDWFVMNGKELTDRSTQNVTFSADVFAPEFVRLEVKREPVVRKKDDGTWEISFKERERHEARDARSPH